MKIIITYIEDETNNTNNILSLKMKEINLEDIKEVIQYQYSKTIESMEQRFQIYKKVRVSSCEVGSTYAKLITNTEDLFIVIDDAFLEKVKELNLYHIIEL